MEMDDLQEPLISNREPDHREDDVDDASTTASVDSRPADKSSPGLFMWLLTLSAGISGLLFGYDTGVISATLISIDRSLDNRDLTSLDKSIITSATALSALLISPFSSLLADRLGRKRVILYADLLFTAGALVQALSASVAAMVLGRAVVGAAIGAASFVVPMYISELAPAAHRGRLVTMNSVFVTGGQVVAYVVGWVFAEFGSRASGWRWMVGLGAAPAVVQALLIVLMPETPRWLVRAGRVDEAREVIRRVAGDGGGVGAGAGAGAAGAADEVLRDIEAEVRAEEQATKARRRGLLVGGAWRAGWDELLTVRRNRRALAIACMLQGLQQLCGFNSLMYFSATIFMMVGFTSPTLTSMSVAVTNWLFTIVALVVIDRVGRRRILLYSTPFMVAGLLLSAWGFSLLHLSTSASEDLGAAPPSSPAANKGAAVIVLVSIMIYVASYAIGWGNVPWMQSELFSLSARSLGSGAATATNWGCNFVVGLTFLPLMNAISPPWTFVLYAVVCMVGLWLVARIYPETSGLSLEEAATLLERDDWGVGGR